MQIPRDTLLILILSASLFLAVPLQAFAVPWASSGFAQHHTGPSRTRNVFPQLRWLRDTAIEKVFGSPPRVSQVFGQAGCDKHSSRLTSHQLPPKLLAKYGGDVVLRFNLSAAHEERALAQAADTLFLDTWEFTSNWADIRLREDDVGFIPLCRGPY